VPGRQVKREIAKHITTTLLNGRVSVGTLDSIHQEIDESEYLTSDPVTIIEAIEAGIMPERIGAAALGLPDGAYKEAQQDHADRIQRIMQAQQAANPGPLTMPGERMAGRVIASETRMVSDNKNNRGGVPPKEDPAAAKTASPNASNDPAARGAPDFSVDPNQAPSQEKATSRNRTMQPTRKKRVRGRGRFTQGE
jgi:hypothetical protein